MTLGQVALKPIDEPSLGRAEDEPVVTRLLQVDKELLTTVFCFLVDIVPAIEFGLERKLTAQRIVGAALAPDADVRVGSDPLTKIQNPEVLKHFLDDCLVHQFDPIGVGCLQRFQRRKHAGQGSHRLAIAFRRLAQGELGIVGEQQSVPAHLIPQRQSLRLELDSVNCRQTSAARPAPPPSACLRGET